MRQWECNIVSWLLMAAKERSVLKSFEVFEATVTYLPKSK